MADEQTGKMPLNPRVFVVKAADLVKIDKAEAIVESGAREVEDAFSAGQTGLAKEGSLVPPYDLTALERTVQNSAILPPLIDAMEVNIDGTGFEIVDQLDSETTAEEDAAAPTGDPVEDDATAPEDPAQAAADAEKEKRRAGIKAFFDETYFGQSLLSLRRRLRRDRESTGNGYIEIQRNTAREIVMLRRLDPKGVRLIRLGDPVQVKKTLNRSGQNIELEVDVRERRFAQSISSKIVYFKEFGASRDLDKTSGEWAAVGAELPIEVRASEILHLPLKPDASSPYGLPRWISTAPSVVGARRAEEMNLEFFDSGGVPPLMILVQGGKVAEELANNLQEYFMARGPNRSQAIVVEAFSASGDIDKPSPVKVTVERFGSDRQSDSMFEEYIAKCDARAQRAFRLPSIFLGMSSDYNFATAYASYLVGEAQVFAPERAEFDEIINLKIMPELDPAGEFQFRSLPMTVQSIENKLTGFTLVKDLVEPEDLVEEVNAAFNTALSFKEPAPIPAALGGPIDPNAPPGHPSADPNADPNATPSGKPGAPGEPKPPAPIAKSEAMLATVTGLHAMAQDAAAELRKGVRTPESAVRLAETMREVGSLRPDEYLTFRALLAFEQFPDVSVDPEGAAELAGCTLATIAANERG